VKTEKWLWVVTVLLLLSVIGHTATLHLHQLQINSLQRQIEILAKAIGLDTEGAEGSKGKASAVTKL
jgi:Na+/alanine symporter